MLIGRQKKARLANGDIVREGDMVEFINSDREICRGRIERSKSNPKLLCFWNNNFKISDYTNAYKTEV